MLLIAVLLLPALSLLLVALSRIEDRLLNDADPVHHARHARPRHLRLIPGGRSAASGSMLPAQRSHARKHIA
ncbi:hypothetical protein ACFQ7M_36020 [Streptomyces massasporeus]